MTRKSTELELRLIDNVSRQSKTIAAAMNGLGRSVKGLESFGRTAVGFAASSLAVLQIGRAMKDSLGEAVSLQSALNEISIKGDLGGEEVLGMGRRLASLSDQVNQSQAALVEGVDAILGAGLSTSVAVGGIGLIGKTATASGASVDDLSKTLSALNQNLGVAPGAEMTKSFEALIAAGNAGAFELKDMASYFPQLTASASALGSEGAAGVADLAAALQIARRGAGDASTAANNLSNFLGKLGSKDFIDNFAKMGVDVTKELAIVKKKGISPIEHFIGLIDKKTKGGRVDLLSQLFGDKQVVDFIRPMISDFEDYVEIRDKAAQSGGIIDRQYAKRMQTAEQRMKRFGIAWSNAKLEVGANLLEPVSLAADRFARSLSTMSDRVGVLDRVGAAWAGFSNGVGLGAGGIADLYDALDRSIFGDFRTLEADSDAIGRISLTFKRAGEAMKTAVADFNAATGFRDTAKAIADGARALNEALGPAGIAGLLAGAAALARIARVLGRFTIGGSAMRLAAVALGITALTNSLDGMSALDLAGIGIGLAAVAGPLLRISRAMTGIGRAKSAVDVLKGTAAVAPGLDAAAAPAAGAKNVGGLGAGRVIGTGLGAIGMVDMLADTTPQKAAARGKEWNEWATANIPTPRSLLGLDVPSAPATGDAMRASLSVSAAPRRVGTDNAPAPAPVVPMSIDTVKLTKGYQRHYQVPPDVVTGFAAQMQGAFKAAFAGLEALRPGPSMLAGFTAAFATLSASAASTGSAMASSLNITATPVVNTSSITAATRAVEGLRASMASIGMVKAGPSPLVQATAPAAALVDGKRAGGGPVQRGMTYLVGERGPEVFSPQRPGTIIPNHDLAAGMNARAPTAPAGTTFNVTNNITVSGQPGRDVGQEIAKAIQSRLNRSRQISINDRPVG